MKKKEIIFILIVGIIIGSIFAGYGSYAATTYAIHSENVEYKDSTNNTITNVQAAINGTCTKFSDQLETFKSTIKNNEFSTMFFSGASTTVLTDGDFHVLDSYTSYQNSNTSIMESNSTKLTIKKSGNYMITAYGLFAAMSSDRVNNVKRVAIMKNSTSAFSISLRTSTWETMVTPNHILYLEEGAVIQVGIQCEGTTTSSTATPGYYGLVAVYLG